MNAPKEVSGVKVILYSPIDERHNQTGNCKHLVVGVLMGAATGLAICQYEGEESFYLFGCDENWETLTDTWHKTLGDAKAQAEFEYEGISATWQKTKE